MTSLRVGKGKVVYVTYSIVTQEGQVFEQSDLPIGYIQGSDKGLYLQIEQALEGRAEGDSVSVPLPPEQGFGPRLPELAFTDDLDNVPPEFRYVGAQVQFENEAGEVKDFVVTKIEDGRLTVDGNHPLAGQTATFHVTVVQVREPTSQELKQGEPLDSPGLSNIH